jgi:PAS domain S-box-containing protein
MKNRRKTFVPRNKANSKKSILTLVNAIFDCICILALLIWMMVFGVCALAHAQQTEPGGVTQVTGVVRGSAAPEDKVSLTPEMRQWLVEHDGQIRIGITVIPPQVLRADREYKGLSIDYIHLMEHKIGCRFKLVPYATWNEVIQAARMRRIDMIFAAQRTPERLIYLLFTEPYIELPNMILLRKNRQGGSSLKEMKGWSIATSEGSAVHEYLKRDFGYLDLHPVQDELSGLMKVSIGEIDAMVVELSRASYYIEKAGILNLRVAGNAGLLYQLRFAVRNDWPVLCGILDKGLSSITDEERQDINRRWIIVGVRSVFASRTFWILFVAGLGMITLSVVGVIVWNRTLRKIVRQRTSQLQQEVGERKQAEDKILHLKNYLANIVDSMPSVLVGMDSYHNVTQWNRQAETMTGISSGEAIGHNVSPLLPDFSPWIKAMTQEIDSRRPASMEKLLIEKEGDRHFYDLVLYPLIANGVEGAVIHIEEVTERVHIQELMIQTEKMMSVGGLAAGMAHEINNPLGIITQAAQNIERRVSSDLPANRKVAEEVGISIDGLKAYFEKRRIPEFISSIMEASLRASNIITNMLRFSSSAGRVLQSLSLENVMEQALGLTASDYDLKKKYDFKNIEIVRDYAPDMPKIPIVSVEIEQVILNLLKNSAQAMITNPPGRKPKIIIRLRREERYALIEIEDNGPGMEENIRHRVFEPFFTTKEPGIGTGLGLSVSYMIVTQNHKGLIEVESTPDKGTCFRVRLPLSKGKENER